MHSLHSSIVSSLIYREDREVEFFIFLVLLILHAASAFCSYEIFHNIYAKKVTNWKSFMFCMFSCFCHWHFSLLFHSTKPLLAQNEGPGCIHKCRLVYKLHVLGFVKMFFFFCIVHRERFLLKKGEMNLHTYINIPASWILDVVSSMSGQHIPDTAYKNVQGLSLKELIQAKL